MIMHYIGAKRCEIRSWKLNKYHSAEIGRFFFFFLLWTHISPLREPVCRPMPSGARWLELSHCNRLLQAADGWVADALGCANLCSVGNEGCPHTERLSCYPTHRPDLPVQIRRWWRSLGAGWYGRVTNPLFPYTPRSYFCKRRTGR